MGETAEPEQRETDWLAKLPEEKLPEEITEEEIAKREEEKKVIAQTETEESTTMAKRKGYRVFIYGKGFKNSHEITAKFTCEDKSQRSSLCIFKNPGMLAATIPDMGPDVPEGDHLVSVEISLNSQQYSAQGIQFLYKAVDPNLTDEDLKKMDEEDAKGAKKVPPKKK